MILYLEKRGCNFWGDERIDILSDVGNYRVCTPNECIPGKDGRMYFLEFTSSTHWKYRTTHKVTGKPLKHEIKEVLRENQLCVDTQFTNPDGLSYRNCTLEKQFWDGEYYFTLADILRATNEISTNHYDSIEFIKR